MDAITNDAEADRPTETAHRIEVDGCGIHVTVQRGAARRPQPPRPTQPTQPSQRSRPSPRERDEPRALVCLHGGPGVEGSGQRLMFSELTDVVDLVVPDQRGHGLSDLSTPDLWNLDRWADDLAAVIAELHLVDPVVFGISFGGWVALHHAFRHPGQAAGLIIASTTPRLPTIEQVAQRMGTLGGHAAEQAWLSVHADANEQAVARMREACMPLMARRPPSPALAAVRATQRLTPQVNEHFTPQFQELDLTDELRTVAVPTLLIVGEHDPLLTPEVIASAGEALPDGGRLVVVPDAAHDLFADAPEVLLGEVRGFVGGL